MLFASLVLARRQHYFARAKQKSLKISSLCGRRFCEIFTKRMVMCRKAAEKLGLRFRLQINDQLLL